MVSTRNHPTNFPPPDLSPSKSTPPTPTTRKRRATGRPRGWSHTPSNLTILWLLVSIPLVAWDTGYVFLRPHSMPGGRLHWPIWQPYALYGTVDYVYGFPSWEASNGFTAAQGLMNIVESVIYIVYLVLVGKFGIEDTRVEGRGTTKVLGWLGAGRVVSGQEGGLVVILGLIASVMTLSKTALYWANEAFSGWSSIGHNDASSLIFLWVIPNGAWLIFPTYMTYVFFTEIYEGLAIASKDTSRSSLLAIKDE